MPADLIIYAVVAVVLVVWLKNTLGTQGEGDEPIKTVRGPLPSIEELSSAELDAAPLVENTPQMQIDAVAEDKSGIIAIDNEAAEQGVVSIIEAASAFDLKFFFGAVQDVFVMVVEAFADGDRDTLEDVLGDDVYTAFDQVIAAREEANQSVKSEVTSIRQAHIIEAMLKGKSEAFITVRFEAEQTHCVYDSEGALIEGHPERADKMTDIWVFSRDLKSRDPRWFVVETRGDFEGDNDIIPNA